MATAFLTALMGGLCLPAFALDAEEPLKSTKTTREKTTQGYLAPTVVKDQTDEIMTEHSGAYTTTVNTTATRLNLSPRHTPQTVSSVTQAQIRDFRLDDINQLLSTASGIVVQFVETDRTYYTARGFDVSNFQIDGVGMPFATGDTLGNIDTALYDHIEVLKGANGLLSNPGNPAATINLIRKRPTHQFQASASLSNSSWDTKRAVVDVSGSLTSSGGLRGRVIAVAQDGDSYLDRYSLEKNVFSGLIEMDIGSHSVATLGYSQQQNRPSGSMWGGLPLHYSDGTPISYDRSFSNVPSWTYWNTDDEQAFIDVVSQWGGGWESHLSLNVRELNSDGELFYVIGLPNPDTGLGMLAYPSKYNHTERQTVVDAYVKGPFQLAGREHELVLGVNGARSDNALKSSDDDLYVPLESVETFNGNFPRPDFDQGITGRGDFEVNRSSVYAALNFSITDNLLFLGGANMSTIKSDGLQYGTVHDYDKSKVAPYVGVIYDLNENYSAYASYTEIFNPQYYVNQAGSILDPIEGESMEFGFKGQWLDQRLNGSVAIFSAEESNTAEYAGYENGASFYTGIDTQSEGVDLTLAGKITSNLEVNIGYTHLFSLEDNDGDPTRTYIPKTNLYAGAVLRVAKIQGLKVGLNVTWQSDISREQATASDAGDPIITEQDAYSVLNAVVSYDINENVNLALNVDNVLDDEHYSSLYWDQSFLSPPRNTRLSLNIRF